MKRNFENGILEIKACNRANGVGIRQIVSFIASRFLDRHYGRLPWSSEAFLGRHGDIRKKSFTEAYFIKGFTSSHAWPCLPSVVVSEGPGVHLKRRNDELKRQAGRGVLDHAA